MRTGMAVAADDRHSRLRQSKFRPDHVHNSLLGRIHVEQRHPEFFAVVLQCLNLTGGDGICDGSAPRRSRNIVINSCYRAMRLSNFASSSP